MAGEDAVVYGAFMAACTDCARRCACSRCGAARRAVARAARSARVTVARNGGSVRALGTRGAYGNAAESRAAVARGTQRARRCSGSHSTAARSAVARATRSARYSADSAVRALSASMTTACAIRCDASVARGTHRARRCTGPRSARTRGAVARATCGAECGINVAVRAPSASMATAYDIRCAASISRGTDRARGLACGLA